MKTKFLFLSLAGIALAHEANAIAGDVLITWTGTAGYSTHIFVNYDDSFAQVGAWGGGAGPYSGVATNQGINQLTAQFYAPSSLDPFFVVDDVENGVIGYKFLQFTFNTATDTLEGYLDFGKDSFAEEDPESLPGECYLNGTPSFLTLHDSHLVTQLDSGGQFTVTPVPEPSTLGLLTAGAGIHFLNRRKQGTRERDSISG